MPHPWDVAGTELGGGSRWSVTPMFSAIDAGLTAGEFCDAHSLYIVIANHLRGSTWTDTAGADAVLDAHVTDPVSGSLAGVLLYATPPANHTLGAHRAAFKAVFASPSPWAALLADTSEHPPEPRPWRIGWFGDKHLTAALML